MTLDMSHLYTSHATKEKVEGVGMEGVGVEGVGLEGVGVGWSQLFAHLSLASCVCDPES